MLTNSIKALKPVSFFYIFHIGTDINVIALETVRGTVEEELRLMCGPAVDVELERIPRLVPIPLHETRAPLCRGFRRPCVAPKGSLGERFPPRRQHRV